MTFLKIDQELLVLVNGATDEAGSKIFDWLCSKSSTQPLLPKDTTPSPVQIGHYHSFERLY